MLNTIVKVEGITKADGTLHAKEVEGIENNNGMEAEGFVTQVVGNPAAQTSIVAQDGSGNGMDDTKVGTTVVVDVTGAQYKVSQGNIDTSGIGGLPSPPNFPFDATTIHAGQRVEVESASAMNASSIYGREGQAPAAGAQGYGVRPQRADLCRTGDFHPYRCLRLSVRHVVRTDDSHCLLAAGRRPAQSRYVNNGDSVRVRGLVFFTGSSFNMIARRIDQ